MDHIKQKKLKKDLEDCDTCDTLKIFKKMQEKNSIENKPMKPPIILSSNDFWKARSPPDMDELGNCGWTLLHTMAAYFPEKPSQKKKAEMKNFLESFAKVYPCKHCAKDFQQILQTLPLKLENQNEFAHWMCQAHNHVNKKLGKPEFDCSKVNERWRIQKDESAS
jgi:FAD-linked sulfhydryl oxidase